MPKLKRCKLDQPNYEGYESCYWILKKRKVNEFYLEVFSSGSGSLSSEVSRYDGGGEVELNSMWWRKCEDHVVSLTLNSSQPPHHHHNVKLQCSKKQNHYQNYLLNKTHSSCAFFKIPQQLSELSSSNLHLFNFSI